jgi:regulation of enolase protein 1 (concanavalin A-like superfamily)
MQRTEQFLGSSLPQGFHWFNEPSHYRLGDGLEIFTDEKTDFWQRTHYGFQRDDGHCLLIGQSGDFSLTAHVEFQPHQMYDQCGLMVRIDSQNWIKVSTEYESEGVSRLGSVVTNLGYSDWATQDIPSIHRAMWYRISKRGNDFLLENSYDGQTWQQMRITHLHKEAEKYDIGVYACSPIGKDFQCCFKSLEISDNQWREIAAAS